MLLNYKFTSINAHFIREPFTRSLLLGYEYVKQHNFLSHQHNKAMRVKYFVDLLQV